MVAFIPFTTFPFYFPRQQRQVEQIGRSIAWLEVCIRISPLHVQPSKFNYLLQFVYLTFLGKYTCIFLKKKMSLQKMSLSAGFNSCGLSVTASGSTSVTRVPLWMVITSGFFKNNSGRVITFSSDCIKYEIIKYNSIIT